MTNFQSFMKAASHCFVKKNSLLASSYKTGYPEYSQLFTEINIAGAYLHMLPLLGNNYALTSEEVTKVIYHIMKMCRLTNVPLPSGLDIIGGVPTIGDNDPIGGGGEVVIVPTVQTYSEGYQGVETFRWVTTHSLDKSAPILIVTDTSGPLPVRVYPAITIVDNDIVWFDFNSTSSGIITVI